MTASRFVNALREKGFLDESSPYLRLVMRRKLAELWKASYKNQPDPVTAKFDIKHALRGAGFEETLQGELRPPVAKYALGEEGGGFYAEFPTPLTGSGIKRSGEPDATTVNAGVSALPLACRVRFGLVPSSVN